MQRIADLVVFVLATTKGNKEYSAFEHRIVEIASTWGTSFKNLYFVLGTNIFDYKFLTDKCNIVDRAMPSAQYQKHHQQQHHRHNRRLKAHTPQTSPVDAVKEYVCPRDDLNINITFLWIANCTGEYFGIGPTCRCQEAMRYYNNHPDLGDWFGFFDDDMHLRPYALQSMLREHSRKMLSVNSRVGFVSAMVYRSFQFSKRWNPETHNCSISGVHDFPIAQPAFLNRHAMQSMKSSVNSNSLTRLQDVWGGTHDAILGMLLWMHKVSLVSFGGSYCGDEMIHGVKQSIKCNKETTVLLHKVQNRRWKKKQGSNGEAGPRMKWDRSGSQTILRSASINTSTLAPTSLLTPSPLTSTQSSLLISYMHSFGQRDVARWLGDLPLYTYARVHDTDGSHRHPVSIDKSGEGSGSSVSGSMAGSAPTFDSFNASYAVAATIMQEQINVGLRSMPLLMPLRPSGFDSTAYVRTKRWGEYDVGHFSPRDC